MGYELGRFNTQDLAENGHKILGIGINKRSNSAGIFSVNYTTLSQAKDNLMNLLSTRKGERVHQPEFGSDVWKVIFEPIDETIDNSIESAITEAVTKWLPYLVIERIEITYDENDIDRHTVYLNLLFRLANNPNFFDSVTVQINQ